MGSIFLAAGAISAMKFILLISPVSASGPSLFHGVHCSFAAADHMDWDMLEIIQGAI